MILETFKVGPMDCNCSILVCPQTSETVVIDPGGNEEEILFKLEKLGARVKLILITHAHFDHVVAADKLKKATGAPICLHEKDIWLYRLMPLQFLLASIEKKAPPHPDRLLKEGDLLEAGTLSLSVIHTPGHSPGSSCYHMDERKMLFAGDTLFHASVGNWRVPFGALEPLIHSIQTKLMALPDQTRVFPGHGDETSIGFERANNPFLDPAKIAEFRKEERNRPSNAWTVAKIFLAVPLILFMKLIKRKG